MVLLFCYKRGFPKDTRAAFQKNDKTLGFSFFGELFFSNFFLGVGKAVFCGCSAIFMKLNRCDADVFSQWLESELRFNILPTHDSYRDWTTDLILIRKTRDAGGSNLQPREW